MTRLQTRFAHVPLTGGPSPVRRLDLPGEVWVKDDGGIGTVYGGNKVRKLEWTLADAKAKGATCVLTGGALATNHGLATALYARELGLRTTLLLVDQPMDDHVAAAFARLQATGARIHRARTPRRAYALAPWVYLRSTGRRRPYWLPVGGSSPLGVLGFVEAGLELAEQVEAGELPLPARVVLAVGSGGCAAGLLVGLQLAGLTTQVHGVLVNDATPVTHESVLQMAVGAARLVGVPAPRDGLVLDTRWLGPGYGHPTAEATAAAAVLAEQGVSTEPVYTAKAAAALLDLPPGEPVLFWQTHNTRPLD
ncbi:MAG TPA: pyridoxal-phosphate dependent enzyme [Mycobacteriales bacterium]|nr:pyridoxal-phosphate dependent enzyme [Mycobacteriales bacterium]